MYLRIILFFFRCVLYVYVGVLYIVLHVNSILIDFTLKGGLKDVKGKSARRSERCVVFLRGKRARTPAKVVEVLACVAVADAK